MAKDYYKPRFDTEQVSDIKDALNLFEEDRLSRHTAENFLYLTAKQKGNLDSREQIKARRLGQALPKDFRGSLPTIEEIEKELESEN